MKGSETKLVAYMQGTNKRFVIPVYQRNYEWKKENCKQLFDDLVKIKNHQRKSHFFGSIVSVHNPEGVDEELLIIDGQQRLTTVSLLLLAMYHLIKSNLLVPKDVSLADRIYEEYLIDKWQKDDTKIKLRPVKSDRIAFSRLFSDEEDYIIDSNLTINYHYFYERIQKQELTVDELFDAICKLEIIYIKLNPDDNPQLIFESLNSTGLALSEGDKIRNLILMGLSSKLQNEYYEKYWNKIEVFTSYKVSLFIRDYLSVKQQSIPALNRVYYTFKQYVEDEQIETEMLLQDMLNYAKWYEILLKGNTKNKKLNACIYRLNRLETTVTRPFFLEVLRLYTESLLSIDEVSEIFLITEIYLFRRTICDLPTNALNKIFLSLHRDIINYDGTEQDYLNKFKYALLSRKEKARFPDDREFIELFSSRQIYQMNSKSKIYLLERFENYDTVEDKDIYRHFDAGDYSIEHIMPQHLTPVWQKTLGSDYEEIHNVWLHRIANLTLTAYNGKYSNSSFTDKKNMTNGFLESGIRMNQWISKFENWGLEEMQARTNYLMELALRIWAAPVTTYHPERKQLDSVTLEDDIVVSNRKIVKFSYKKMEQPVSSWIDMYERVIKILHSEDESVLKKLASPNSESPELSAYISQDKKDLRRCIVIEDGLYMERNTSTFTKISTLKRLFKLYQAEPSDLVFYLRGDDEEQEKTTEKESSQTENKETVGKLAYRLIKELLLEGKLIAEEIEKLQTKSYSNNLFSEVYYPIISLSRNPDDMEERHRYYAKPVNVGGVNYYITSQWFEPSRDDLIAWYKKHE